MQCLITYCSFVSGILIGTLTMELGGTVTIKCEKTGYWAELEFKLKVSAALHMTLTQTAF